jgi:hypothetical protein
MAAKVAYGKIPESSRQADDENSVISTSDGSKSQRREYAHSKRKQFLGG